jgi:hypothetical protein
MPRALRSVIAILNALFDAQATIIDRYGGEILKFIGDGLLAIFPIAEASAAGVVAQHALTAALETIAAIPLAIPKDIRGGEERLRMVIALHRGTVVYGRRFGTTLAYFSTASGSGAPVGALWPLECQQETFAEPPHNRNSRRPSRSLIGSSLDDGSCAGFWTPAITRL